MSNESNVVLTGAARARVRSAITSAAGWRDYKSLTGKSVSEYTRQDYIEACISLGLDIHAIVADGAAGDDTAAAVPPVTVTAAVPEGMKPVTAAAVQPVTVTAAAVQEPNAAGKPLYDLVRDHMLLDIAPQIERLVTKRLETVSTIRIEMVRDGVKVGAADGHHHPLFATLCRVLSARQADGFAPNLWITGPAGSGKTYACHAFAKAAGLDFYYNGSLTAPHELLGFIDANGTCHDTPFRRAYEHGGVYVFDEVDGSTNEALLSLNAALANGKASFPDRLVTRHPDCIVIATANTFGTGATAEYIGRAKLDAAFLDRFGVKLSWGYDTALETALSGNPAWARRVQAARERAYSAGLKVIISPRATLAGAAQIANGFTPDEVAQFTYLAGLSKDQRKIVEGL